MIKLTQQERDYLKMFERKQGVEMEGILIIEDKVYIRFHDLYSCSLDDIIVDIVRDIPVGVVKKYLDEEMDAAMYGIEPPIEYDNWLRIHSIIA